MPNKGNSFRLKLAKVTARFGFTVRRVRAAYRDADGIDYPEDVVELKVLDSGQVSQRFQNIVTDFIVANNNQSNPDLKILIYPAPVNTLTPDYTTDAILKEDDEVYFNGFVHVVTRQDMLPIQDVNVYFTATCTRLREIGTPN